MKVISIFLVTFISVHISDGVSNSSGFVTLWSPKFAQEDSFYRVFLLPTNVNYTTEAAVQFRKSYATVTLKNNKLSLIDYNIKQRRFGNGTTLDLTMTLHQNNSGISVCSTKKIPIVPSIGNFYNFIQTDKPIYKPGDKVQFRVLTVDRDLKPFHRDSIDVTIIDPFNRNVKSFTDQAGQYVGVFTGSFDLSLSTVLGNWRIKVIVDKKPSTAVSKTFAVQEYVLPLFEVHVEIERPHLLPYHELKIKIYATYSFGEYVTGNANLLIRNAINGIEYSNEAIRNIAAPRLITKNLRDLKINDEAKVEAFVEFTEPESEITFNKSVVFNVHLDTKYKLIVLHPEKFLPEFPLSVEVYVNDWKNEKVVTHNEFIEINFELVAINGTKIFSQTNDRLNNSKVSNEFLVPKDIEKLRIRVKFPNSLEYFNDLAMGSVNIGINKLKVGHTPKNAKLNSQIRVIVTNDLKLDDILVAVITRHGNAQTKQVSCNGTLNCQFDIKVSKQMMPQSTIMVYSVKNMQNIYQGKTVIETESLSGNYLQIQLSEKQIMPRKKVRIELNTKPNSQIYILAYDKRLKYLNDGNDFTNDDVIKTVADYDDENLVIVDNLAMHYCSSDELERVKNGRRLISGQSESTLYANSNFDDDNEYPFDESYEEEEIATESARENDFIRELFPETWIFKEIKNGKNQKISEAFTTPDSITTWMISSFSVNKDNGIALAPVQELVVESEFFVELNLPYSIRYTEVLRLDVLVFNYLKSNEPADVTVTVFNNQGLQFQFVEKSQNSNSCNSTYNNNKKESMVITVPASSVRKAYFYIRSNPINNEFDSKNPQKIVIVASGIFKKNGKTYKDTIKKRLTVEPVGIKTFEEFPLSFNLNGEVSRPIIRNLNISENLVRINVLATGDILGNVLEEDKLIQHGSNDCLEQRTSKFKQSADIYRYLNAIDRNSSLEFFKSLSSKLLDQLQSVRNAFDIVKNYNYRDHGWYRAHLIDALGTVHKSKAFVIQKSEIDKHFTYLKDLQASNGSFSNFNFEYMYMIKCNNFTERFISTSLALIAFLKHKDLVDTDYGDVVDKAFSYLKIAELSIENQGRPIAAYAYALDGREIEAQRLLVDPLEMFIMRDNKKCFKINSSETSCDVLQTSYIALTLLQLNQTAYAQPIIDWLKNYYAKFKIKQQTFFNSILTTPLAEMGIAKKSSDVINLKIKLRNEHGHKERIEITKENSKVSQNVILPRSSTEITLTASGHGYCAINIIYEKLMLTNRVNPSFELNISTNDAKRTEKRRIVKVCAEYDSERGTSQDTIQKTSIVNVIYEINLPSGYVFKEIKDFDELSEIKQVTTDHSDTIAFVYYNDFKEKKKYCIDVLVEKKFDVKNPKAAAVKVYDFDIKGSRTKT